MTVGQIVHHAIGLMRVAQCQHEWVHLNDTEDRCTRCRVIATEEGKKNLERARRRRSHEAQV